MAKKKLFLDFDRTLFDLDAYMDDLVTAMEQRGHAKEDVWREMEKLNEVGYSFEAHLRALGEDEEGAVDGAYLLRRLLRDDGKYLYPEVNSTLIHLRNAGWKLVLLTFGHSPYQQWKWHGCGILRELFCEAICVSGDQCKGEVISHLSSRDEDVVFVDDSPKWIERAWIRAPWVRCVKTHQDKPEGEEEGAFDPRESFSGLLSFVQGAPGPSWEEWS